MKTFQMIFNQVNPTFEMKLEGQGGAFDVDLGKVIYTIGGDAEPYTGSYEVTPKAFEAQTLATAGKLMSRNVKVEAVPYYETSNVSGTTIYIAASEG